MSSSAEVTSPCISVCVMDDTSGLCQGCYRTLDEIQGWWDLEADQQREILLKVGERELQQFD